MPRTVGRRSDGASSSFGRGDLAVAGGPSARLLRQRYLHGRTLEEVGDLLEPLWLGARLEQLLLRARLQLDAARELVREQGRERVRQLHLGLHQVDERAERGERAGGR